MNWQEVCENQDLQNLPFKIELNEQGQILMTPVKVYHSIYQGRITGLLYSHLENGDALVECAIKTTKGTKVADVAWASNERLNVIKNEAECSIAPEICIEIMSSTNTEEEMECKKKLYFEKGAKEVWICSESGDIHFYRVESESGHSLLAPNFPHRI
jgi:Uma2 family endonuclease